MANDSAALARLGGITATTDAGVREPSRRRDARRLRAGRSRRRASRRRDAVHALSAVEREFVRADGDGEAGLDARDGRHNPRARGRTRSRARVGRGGGGNPSRRGRANEQDGSGRDSSRADAARASRGTRDATTRLRRRAFPRFRRRRFSSNSPTDRTRPTTHPTANSAANSAANATASPSTRVSSPAFPASGRSSNKVGSTSPSYSPPIDPNVRLDFFVDGVGPVDVAVTFARYRSHAGDDGFSPSGAYVFRPAEQLAETLVPDPSSVVTVETSVVSETHKAARRAGGRISRRDGWAGASHAEIEWTVGPVPVDERGRVGSEIVVRYAADLATRGAWATDANGGDMQTLPGRRTDAARIGRSTRRNPSLGIITRGTSVVAAEDATAGMHVVVDRSQGVASLRDGEIETMVHRRVLRDDGCRRARHSTRRGCGCPPVRLRGAHREGDDLPLGVVETSENPAAYRARCNETRNIRRCGPSRARRTTRLARRRALVPLIAPRERANANVPTAAKDGRPTPTLTSDSRETRICSRSRSGARARSARAELRRSCASRTRSKARVDRVGTRRFEAGHVDLSALFSGRVAARAETDDARGTTHAGRRLPGVEARGRHARADGDQGGGRGVRGS